MDRPVIRITYAQAERVGRRLCMRWKCITGRNPPILPDEAWADMVQNVLRWAEAEGQGGEAGKGA